MTTVRLPRKSVLYQNVKLLRTDKARASCAIHCGDLRLPYDPCADPENFLKGGGGGPNSQKESYGKFQHGKNQNYYLAVGGGGGGGPDPLSPPLDPPMRSACGFVSERRQKADSEIVRCPYEL